MNNLVHQPELDEGIDVSMITIIMSRLDVGLGFVEAYRVQRVVEDLRARVAPAAAVLRAGAWSPRPTPLVP